MIISLGKCTRAHIGMYKYLEEKFLCCENHLGLKGLKTRFLTLPLFSERLLVSRDACAAVENHDSVEINLPKLLFTTLLIGKDSPLKSIVRKTTNVLFAS